MKQYRNHVVYPDKGELYVSTALTPDHGWETMAFDHTEGNDHPWEDIIAVRHADEGAAYAYHVMTVRLALKCDTVAEFEHACFKDVEQYIVCEDWKEDAR